MVRLPGPLAALGIVLGSLTGCAMRPSLAADLPRVRPLPTVRSWDELKEPPERRPVPDLMIPVVHPPDAMVVAREPYSRGVTRLKAALAQQEVPVEVNWALLGLVIAF